MPDEAKDKPVLDPEDLEFEFDIPRSTQAKRRMTGDFIPHVKVGRRVLYLREDVVEWLKAQRRLSTAASALEAAKRAAVKSRKQ